MTPAEKRAAQRARDLRLASARRARERGRVVGWWCKTCLAELDETQVRQPDPVRRTNALRPLQTTPMQEPPYLWHPVADRRCGPVVAETRRSEAAPATPSSTAPANPEREP